MSPSAPTTYIGRFAPSPTGPLHFGSLLAAVASFLDARASGGRWLVRMEDLDPPREPPGAADKILEQLTQFGLHWDGDILYQSTRLEQYEVILKRLLETSHAYPCTCTRPQIREMGAVYDGRCRNRTAPPRNDYALRLRTANLSVGIEDLVLGTFAQNVEADCGDFVIRRKDGLFAYQLAVVVDDEFQGITHVIRGSDLLDSTPRQIFLQQLLHYRALVYGHIPLIVDAKGEKLSKQRFAPAIASSEALEQTHRALQVLGQQPPPLHEFAENKGLLDWAIGNWDIQAVPKLATIPQAPQR